MIYLLIINGLLCQSSSPSFWVSDFSKSRVTAIVAGVHLDLIDYIIVLRTLCLTYKAEQNKTPPKVNIIHLKLDEGRENVRCGTTSGPLPQKY